MGRLKPRNHGRRRTSRARSVSLTAYTVYEFAEIVDENKNLERIYHQTVKKVTEDYENLRFNTAISQMMIFINECYKERKSRALISRIPDPAQPGLPASDGRTERDGPKRSDRLRQMAGLQSRENQDRRRHRRYQINGKIRDKFEVEAGMDAEALKVAALARERSRRSWPGRRSEGHRRSQ